MAFDVAVPSMQSKSQDVSVVFSSQQLNAQGRTAAPDRILLLRCEFIERLLWHSRFVWTRSRA